MPQLTDFLSAYRGREAAMNAQPMQDLQQVGALQAIAQKMQAAQQEQAFRGALAQAKTPEERMAVAERYAGPKDMLAHGDRLTTAANTKELALARLNQTAQMGAQTFALRAQAAKTAQERAEIDAAYKQFQSQIQAERLKYDTGATVAPFQALPGGATAAPQSEGIPFNFNGVRGTVPDDAAAIALAEKMGLMGPASPSPAVAQPATDVAPTATPAAPNNLDARDLGAWSRGPVMGSTPAPVPAPAPSAPVAPQMPQFSGSPRERAAAENRWRLQQDKPSIAGNAPISPETATRIAQQVLNGDLSGSSGWARNQTAKAQIENEVTRLAAELGKSGGDIVGARAMTAANRVALTASTKDLIAIEPFKQMLDQNAKVAMDLGRKIASDKTNSAFVNRPLLWVKNNLGDRPDIAEYLAQMHFVEVEAARVLTQPRLVGQLTDQSISDMKSVLSGNMTIASTEAVLNRIMADGNNRINAMRAAQARVLSDIKGTAPRTRATDKATADQFFR